MILQAELRTIRCEIRSFPEKQLEEIWEESSWGLSHRGISLGECS
jgi:hypothetical protein